VGTMGEAIPLRAQSLQAQAGKVVEQIGTPALLIPSCGGLSADREEKRVTLGSDMIRTRTNGAA